MIELIKVIDSQVLKMAFALEQVVTNDQQRMADGYDRSLASSVSGDSLEESGEVAVFGAGGAPSALAELLPQPAASLSGLAAETLAPAFMISGTDSSPGGPGGQPKETGSCRSRFRR